MPKRGEEALEHQKMNLEDRLQEIICQSYTILCKRIANNAFLVCNESTMQLEFGSIIKSVGALHLYKGDETFSVVMEYVWPTELPQTSKSPNGKPRCDVFVKLVSGGKEYTAAIEMKYFPYSPKDETVTDNKFAIYQDVENLQVYPTNVKYCILYTDNKNYAIKKSDVKYSIAETIKAGTYSNTSKLSVRLEKDYTPQWSTIYDKHHFMIIKV